VKLVTNHRCSFKVSLILPNFRVSALHRDGQESAGVIPSRGMAGFMHEWIMQALINEPAQTTPVLIKQVQSPVR
jgi:hypothetical protein